MTDHTAIIDRMARAMCEIVHPRGHEKVWPDLRHFYVRHAQAALTASGLLEVLEKAEAKLDAYLGILEDARRGYHNVENWDCFGPDEEGPTYDQMLEEAESALRNAIKGVRDGK